MTVTNNWRPRILVVDDDPTNLMLLERLLGRNGYDVVLASSGFEAIDAVKQATPDLILLDIRMPEMDGYEACRRLRSNPITTETPILFLTAEGREDDNLAAGFESILNLARPEWRGKIRFAKDFGVDDPAELAANVERALNMGGGPKFRHQLLAKLARTLLVELPDEERAEGEEETVVSPKAIATPNN